MIRRLSSDLPTFKELEFHGGLNVLLAEKSESATDQHTRNRAGKSSMVELLHLMLGADVRRDSLARHDALAAYTFAMDVDLGGSTVTVERSGSKASPLIVRGDSSTWPVKPRKRGVSWAIKNDDWRIVLGNLMFGLPELDRTWSPTFRSLISYFVRREGNGGFHEAIQQSKHQQLADQQVNLSFLLGLDWTIPQEWQTVRQREKSLAQLKKSLKEGSFGDIIDKASTVRSRLVVARDRANRLQQRIAAFRVIDEYHELEREASRITQRLAELSDENTLDLRYVSELETATELEAPPDPEQIRRVYEEARIKLPELVVRRFEEANEFHAAVIRNRQSYLQTALAQAQSRIAERAREQERLDRRRAEVMGILQSAGALEHFVLLQGECARSEADVERLEQRYDSAEALESGSLRLRMERTRLQERLHENYSEQASAVDAAILTFERISSALYEEDRAGSFSISPGENGPEFSIEIQGSKSKGGNNMQTFCFDLMLMLVSIKRGRSPGFLVHDSHLFDGVDERQVGKALALGARLADQFGFQYIVTMNTDDVPSELPDGFSIENHELPIRLSDASEDGGLFGFRFD